MVFINAGIKRLEFQFFGTLIVYALMSLSAPSCSQSLSLSLSLSNLTPKLKVSDIAIELRVACLSLLPHAPNLPHAAALTTNRTAQRWKRVAGPTINRTALRWRSNELVHVDAISVLSDGILTMEGENEWFLSMLESNGVVILILTLLTLILLRFLFVIHRTGKRLRPTSAKPLSTLIVLGSGGHTAEMLNLLAALQKDRFYPRYYIAAATDNMSLLKAQTFESCSDDEDLFYPINPWALSCQFENVIHLAQQLAADNGEGQS